MPLIVVVVLSTILSVIAGKAGKRAVSGAFGMIAFLALVGWLATGPGFAALDFLNDPKVESPVDINRR